MSEIVSAAEDIATNGFTILDSLISSAQSATIAHKVVRALDDQKQIAGLRGYLGNYLAFDQSAIALVMHAEILELCRSVLGDGFRASMVSASVHYPNMPGGELHRDWPHKSENAFYVPPYAVRGPVHLVVIWMLSDFTVENGGTMLVPRSHFWDEECAEKIASSITKPETVSEQAIGQAGSALVLDARMAHAISPNVSSNPRTALMCRYAVPWLNLATLDQQSLDWWAIVNEAGGPDPHVNRLPRHIFDSAEEAQKQILYPMTESKNEGH